MAKKTAETAFQRDHVSNSNSNRQICNCILYRKIERVILHKEVCRLFYKTRLVYSGATKYEPSVRSKICDVEMVLKLLFWITSWEWVSSRHLSNHPVTVVCRSQNENEDLWQGIFCYCTSCSNMMCSNRKWKWLWQMELQVVTTTNKPTPSFFTGQMPFLLPNQQCQSTEGKNITSHGLAYPRLTWGSSSFVFDH